MTVSQFPYTVIRPQYKRSRSPVDLSASGDPRRRTELVDATLTSRATHRASRATHRVCCMFVHAPRARRGRRGGGERGAQSPDAALCATYVDTRAHRTGTCTAALSSRNTPAGLCRARYPMPSWVGNSSAIGNLLILTRLRRAGLARRFTLVSVSTSVSALPPRRPATFSLFHVSLVGAQPAGACRPRHSVFSLGVRSRWCFGVRERAREREKGSEEAAHGPRKRLAMVHYTVGRRLGRFWRQLVRALAAARRG